MKKEPLRWDAKLVKSYFNTKVVRGSLSLITGKVIETEQSTDEIVFSIDKNERGQNVFEVAKDCNDCPPHRNRARYQSMIKMPVSSENIKEDTRYQGFAGNNDARPYSSMFRAS